MALPGFEAVKAGDVEAEDMLIVKGRLTSVADVVADVVYAANREIVFHDACP